MKITTREIGENENGCKHNKLHHPYNKTKIVKEEILRHTDTHEVIPIHK